MPTHPSFPVDCQAPGRPRTMRAKYQGCVVTVNTTTRSTSSHGGVRVGIENKTIDPSRPVYHVYHFDCTL